MEVLQIQVSDKARAIMDQRRDLKGVLKIVGDLLVSSGHGVEKNYLSASYENLTAAHKHLSEKLMAEINRATNEQL